MLKISKEKQNKSIQSCLYNLYLNVRVRKGEFYGGLGPLSIPCSLVTPSFSPPLSLVLKSTSKIQLYFSS